MLSLAIGRQSSGIRREKSKWDCIVLAVFGEVEVHAADKIPRGVAAFQKLLDAALRFWRPWPDPRAKAFCRRCASSRGDASRSALKIRSTGVVSTRTRRTELILRAYNPKTGKPQQTAGYRGAGRRAVWILR